MKTLSKALLIAGGVVAALAIIFVALLLQPAQETAESVVFASAEPVDVESVSVENATGTYNFYYEGDGYVLDDIPGTITNLDAFISFMTGCGRLSAVRQVADSDVSLAEYGLENPAAAVVIRFFDANELRLAVGSQERISSDYYVTVEGFPGVYLMAKSLAEPFLGPKTQIISRNVTPDLAVSSPLSAIRDVTFTGGPLDHPVTIQATSDGGRDVELAALSFGTATHIVRGVGVFQLDQTYGVEILGSLFGIPALDIAGYNLTEAEIREFGFDDPWMTVEYDMVNSAQGQLQHCVLQLVQMEDSSCYAMLEGTGAVYVVGRQPFMDLDYGKLLLRWYLAPLLMDLSSVTVEGSGREYRFDIDNTDQLNPVITAEGASLDVELFRAFFRLITSAAHDGNYLGELPQPDSGELLTITYEYREPGKSPDVLTLYPGEVRRANVFINGAGEFAMKDSFVPRVLEGCESLLSGEVIEENW